jgi:hypothetical protein
MLDTFIDIVHDSKVNIYEYLHRKRTILPNPNQSRVLLDSLVLVI